MIKCHSVVALVAVLLAGTSMPVLAQDAEVILENEGEFANTIIVTAQKVEQDVQEVPISISIIGGEQLAARQIDGFDQLQYVAPGIAFNAGVNARQSATTIRGIGTGLFNIGIEASTAIAIDGVVMGREGAGIFDFADVERIEVLRGPQGTLFGKNASAGVVSIVTKGPTDTFQAEASIGYGSFDELNLSGAVSGPLSTDISARLSGYRNTREGYIENINPAAPQDLLNERHEYGLRGKVKFDILPDSSLLISGDYVKRDQAAGALTYRSISPGGPGTGLLGFGVPVSGPTSLALGIVPGPENRQIASEGSFTSVMEAWGVSAEYSIGLGDFELVSLTAYREWDSDDNNDADLIPLPFLAVNFGGLDQDQFSQEIRLISPRNHSFTYTLGAFYFKQDLRQSNIQSGTAGLNLLGALPPGLLLGTNLDSDFREENYALFGQGELALSDSLSLIAGVRVLRSEVEGSQLKTRAAGTVGPYPGQRLSAGRESASDRDTAVVWRAGVQYFLTPDTNVFGTVSRGYKAAGIVNGLTINPVVGNALPVVQPEIPTQYEVGIRHASADRRFTANITGFYTTIDDFQAQTLVPGATGTSIFSVANAGKVETYGFEAELSVLPFDGLSLSTAVAYTNATFDEFPGAPCYALQTAAAGCVRVNGQNVQDLKGKSLAQAPEWVVNALARYDFDLWADNGGFAQVGVQYRDEAQSSITNDPNTLLDDRTLVDAQLGVDFADDRISLTAFVRNLFDEDFVEAITNMPFDTGGYAQFRTLEAERTFGIKLAVRY